METRKLVMMKSFWVFEQRPHICPSCVSVYVCALFTPLADHFFDTTKFCSFFFREKTTSRSYEDWHFLQSFLDTFLTTRRIQRFLDPRPQRLPQVQLLCAITSINTIRITNPKQRRLLYRFDRQKPLYQKNETLF